MHKWIISLNTPSRWLLKYNEQIQNNWEYASESLFQMVVCRKSINTHVTSDLSVILVEHFVRNEVLYFYIFSGAVGSSCDVGVATMWDKLFAKNIWFLLFYPNHINFSGNPAEHECPKNEKFICGGSPCQTTCKTYKCPCNVNTFVAVNACYCIKGYARNANGECIRAKNKTCINAKEPCE